MLEFTRRIQRIDVDYHHAGAQYAKQGNRVLQQIRHHQGNAVALPEPKLILQIGGVSTAALFELAVSHHLAHVDKCRIVSVTQRSIFKHLDQRTVAVRVDVLRNICRISF
ncbi:hypothetical protein SRABI106_04386 [Rahnella aquatilis]|nr:hypothetical protein SRABI106_04386 [Rahnella aquatilis]